jgi:hypothetical protein
MKQQKQSVARAEFASRLTSDEWDRKMHARVDSERKDRLHIRIRIMAFLSAVFISALSITATWWEDHATGTHLYSMMEQAAGGIQDQFSE